LAAGGFTVQADSTRVSIIRRDPANPGKEEKMNVNVSEILNNGRLDLDVEVYPDDFIFVPSKGDAIGEILVTGAVRSPGSYPIPVGVPYTVSQAIFRAGGFDEFANKASVKVVRNKPGTPEEEREITVNVEDVLKKGRRDLDIEVYPDDVVIVPERWFNF
jgi:protein involved in polysaccharide export with SLBB domain